MHSFKVVDKLHKVIPIYIINKNIECSISSHLVLLLIFYICQLVKDFKSRNAFVLKAICNF